MDIKKIKADERFLLLEVCKLFYDTEFALGEKNFPVAQGALRAIFNGIGWLVYNTPFLTDEGKRKLNVLNDSTFAIREDLVDKVEGHGIDLNKVIDEDFIYQRLDAGKRLLEKYTNDWYKV